MYLVVVVGVSIPTAPLCTSIVAFSVVVAVVVCRSCVDQKWSFLFALQKVLSYQTICQRLGPARKAPRGRGGCCSSQAFCWLVKICWHMRWCFCCSCRCSCCFAHQQINAMGPPVNIDKIAVVFSTKRVNGLWLEIRLEKHPRKSRIPTIPRIILVAISNFTCQLPCGLMIPDHSELYCPLQIKVSVDQSLSLSLSAIACKQGKTAAYSAAALEEYQKHRVVLSRYLLAWAIGSASRQRGPLKRSFKASRMFNLIMLKWIHFISFSYANPHSYGPLERIAAAEEPKLFQFLAEIRYTFIEPVTNCWRPFCSC